MADDYDWDEANISHLARHGVTPEEAEEVIANGPIEVEEQERNGEIRLLQLGITDTLRCLAVSTTWRGELLRVVTAYPATPAAEKYFWKIRGIQRMRAMIMKPAFANEAEEADWYADNPDYILQQMERAEAEGRLTHGTVAKRLGLKSSIPTPILLSEDDVNLAATQARLKGLDLSSYLRSIIHEALINAQRQ